MARTKSTARKCLRLTRPLQKMNRKVPLAAPKRKVRYRPGVVALREIRKYQASCNLLIRRRPFQRLVREIAVEYSLDVKFRNAAYMALQEATEMYIVRLMEESMLCAVHGGRVTVMSKDMKLAIRIRGTR